MNNLQLFADCLFEPDDIVEVRMLTQTTRKSSSEWSRAGELGQRYEALAKLNRSYDLYAGANPRCDFGKRGDSSVVLARTLFVDLDGVTIGRVARRLDKRGLPLPTCVVWSGGGVHVYWRLESPVIDLDLWRSCQQQMIKLLDSEPCIHNPERIMRLPGFANHKPERTPSSLVWADPGQRVRLADLMQTCPKVEKPPVRYFPHIVQCHSYYGRSALLQECDRVRKSVNGHRNCTLFKAAAQIGQLVGAGVIFRDDATEALRHAGLECGLDEKEVATTVHSGLTKGATTPRRKTA